MSKTKYYIEKRHLRLDVIESNLKLDDEYHYNKYLEELNVQRDLDNLSELEKLERTQYIKS